MYCGLLARGPVTTTPAPLFEVNPGVSQPEPEQFIQKSLRNYVMRSIEGFLEGKGQQQIVENLKLAAPTDITVHLPRKNCTNRSNWRIMLRQHASRLEAKITLKRKT